MENYFNYIRERKPSLEIVKIDSATLERKPFACLIFDRQPLLLLTKHLADEDAKTCEILLTNPFILKKLGPKLPNLQWVHSNYAGIDQLFTSDSEVITEIYNSKSIADNKKGTFHYTLSCK